MHFDMKGSLGSRGKKSKTQKTVKYPAICVYIQRHTLSYIHLYTQRHTSAQLTFWTGKFFVKEAALCITGCFRAALASIHQMPAALPSVITIKNVSRHCQVSQVPHGVKNSNFAPFENYWFSRLSKEILSSFFTISLKN